MRQHGYAKRGQALELFSTERTGDLASVSVTMCCAYREDGEDLAPLYLSRPRAGTNSARDFLMFMMRLLSSGFVAPGSFIVLDNASIHHAVEIREVLRLALELAQVQLIFLPAYSPEV